MLLLVIEGLNYLSPLNPRRLDKLITFKNEQYILSCDMCDDTIKFDKFSDTVKFKKANGWRCYSSSDIWQDYCPKCIDKVQFIRTTHIAV